MSHRDTDHDANKRFVKDFPDAEILREALEMCALDDTEKEALKLYVFHRVPISIIAERMGYERSYFSRDKFKRILIKYVYCLHKCAKEKEL